MHNLSINSPVLVYRKQNIGQSGEWKRSYNCINFQGKSIIIALPYSPIKFRSTSIKPYFIDNIFIRDQQLIPNSSTSTQEIALVEIPQTEVSLANILLIETSLVEVLSAPFAPLASLV